MDKQSIARINALSRKAKAEGLSDAEKAEQQALRQKYLQSFRANMAQTLDNTYIQTPDGERTKLTKKPE